MESHLAWWSTDSHASRCLSNKPILSCYQRFAEKANIHREVGKTDIHHHTPSWEGGFGFGLIQLHFVHEKTTCTIHVPSKWLEYLFPAMASLKTSWFCQSEVLQPRNMNIHEQHNYSHSKSTPTPSARTTPAPEPRWSNCLPSPWGENAGRNQQVHLTDAASMSVQKCVCPWKATWFT